MKKKIELTWVSRHVYVHINPLLRLRHLENSFMIFEWSFYN